MENYDSILKEKKKYKDNEPIIKKNKFTRYFIIDLFVTVVIIGISYIIYYHNILSPTNIFLHDISYLKTIEEQIISPLGLNLNISNYSLEGNIEFDSYKYDYEIIRDHMKFKALFSNQDSSLTYYLDDSTSYTKINQFMEDKYVEQLNDNLFNTYRNLLKNFNSVITDEQFIKRFYFDGSTPIVEINLVLNKDMIHRLLEKTIMDDDIELLFTFKNHAITDDFIDGKLVIQNKTKNTRKVVTYRDSDFSFTDNNGKKTTYNFQINHEDFTVKVFKDDTLYSILNGIKKENSYQYSYQIIDKYYNLSLEINNVHSETNYLFRSNIQENGQKEEKKLFVSNTLKKDGALDENVSENVLYSKLSKDELNAMQSDIDSIFSPIWEFINKYKDSIN